MAAFSFTDHPHLVAIDSGESRAGAGARYIPQVSHSLPQIEEPTIKFLYFHNRNLLDSGHDVFIGGSQKPSDII
jgi:hypothetical protein